MELYALGENYVDGLACFSPMPLHTLIVMFSQIVDPRTATTSRDPLHQTKVAHLSSMKVWAITL